MSQSKLSFEDYDGFVGFWHSADLTGNRTRSQNLMYFRWASGKYGIMSTENETCSPSLLGVCTSFLFRDLREAAVLLYE